MKKLIITIVFSSFAIAMQAQNGPPYCDDFVRLQGKYFSCGGQAFYPMGVNYNIQYAHINNGSSDTDYIITPLQCSTADYNDMPGRILCDLNKIKDMGFNNIRLLAGPWKNIDPDSGFSINSPKILNWWNDSTYITYKFNSPYTDTNSFAQKVIFKQIRNVLDAAQVAGIKVILATGAGYIANTDDNAREYASFLKAMADYLKDHKALLAYDLDNEPHWETSTSPPPACCGFPTLKSKVCEYTSMWYDSIRAVDLNHLITIGAKDVLDLLDTDPGVMKVDFISEHIYPYEWLGFPDSTYDKQGPMERMKGVLYWLNQVLPMPWIMGEAGFSADDQNVAPGYDHPPHVMGHDTDQVNYARESQEMVLNYGGSGYSWWEFKNKYFYPKDSAFYYQNFFGLLHYGDPDSDTLPGTFVYNNSINKPVVDGAFGSNIPTIRYTAYKPPNYYNPFNTTSNTLGGIVIDQYGSLVSDAIIFGINSSIPPYDYKVYTFSDSIGMFNISTPLDGFNNKFTRLLSVYPGTNIYDTTHNPNLTGSNFVCKLYINSLKINDTIHYKTIQNGQNDTLASLNTLTTTEVYIDPGGIADLHARYDVNLLPGFEAYSGSEVHIYNTVTYPICDCSFKKNANSYVDKLEQQDAEISKEIEIKFKLNEDMFIANVFPNPCNGTFTVNIKCNEIKDCIAEITDILGNKISEREIKALSAEFDISDFHKGIYFLHVFNNENFQIKKIIYQ
jgi:hypothetical protein